MPTDKPAPDLRQLDAAAPFSPDPAVLQHNLTALQSAAPELAKTLQSATPPPDWDAVVALDGTPTYRCRAADGAVTWHTASAVPGERARASFRELNVPDRNLALPTIATGAELLELLERTPPTVAVFVFEPDPAALVAILRLLDFSDAVKAGRCVFVHAPTTRPPWRQSWTIGRDCCRRPRCSSASW
jgi:hypothetical protein